MPEYTHKGLVLAPLLRQHYEPLNDAQRELFKKTHPDVDWFFPDDPLPKKSDGTADWEKLGDYYVDLVNKHDIDVVVGSTHDDGGVIHAYVSENCPKIKGPSVKSVAFCNHAVYCREHIIPEEMNLKYMGIDIDEEIDAEAIIKKVGTPFVLKPACEAASTLVKVIKTADEVYKALPDYKEIIKGTYYDKYGKVLMGLEKEYPLLNKRTIIAEQFVDVMRNRVDIQTVEIAACNGEPIPWVICDNVYWKKHPQVFLACATSPVLTESHQETIWKYAKQMMKVLIDIGFNNSLINIETFTWLSGKVKVMEINPRLAYQCTPLYTAVYENGDNVSAMIHMQQGKKVTTPKSLLGQKGQPRYALNYYLNTFKSGKGKDIYNYEKAKKYQEEHKDLRWDLNFIEPNTEVKEGVQPFFCFGWTYIPGENFADCMVKAKAVSSDLFAKEHHEALWDDSFDWPEYYQKELKSFDRQTSEQFAREQGLL